MLSPWTPTLSVVALSIGRQRVQHRSRQADPSHLHHAKTPQCDPNARRPPPSHHMAKKSIPSPHGTAQFSIFHANPSHPLATPPLSLYGGGPFHSKKTDHSIPFHHRTAESPFQTNQPFPPASRTLTWQPNHTPLIFLIITICVFARLGFVSVFLSLLGSWAPFLSSLGGHVLIPIFLSLDLASATRCSKHPLSSTSSDKGGLRTSHTSDTFFGNDYHVFQPRYRPLSVLSPRPPKLSRFSNSNFSMPSSRKMQDYAFPAHG